MATTVIYFRTGSLGMGKKLLLIKIYTYNKIVAQPVRPS